MNVTVVHEGRVLRGATYEVGATRYWIGDVSWPWGVGESGALGIEGVHWRRGHLYMWIPWHRRTLRALVVAAALAGPVPAPKPKPKTTFHGVPGGGIQYNPMAQVQHTRDEAMRRMDEAVRRATHISFITTWRRKG